mmetsp:Transcript_45485/g.114513  ORF Transcript_45485/g.114513 Transcript_45485/m.114513 type:complete len:363 (+) Transcript_45485:2678-3766(+)
MEQGHANACEELRPQVRPQVDVDKAPRLVSLLGMHLRAVLCMLSCVEVLDLAPEPVLLALADGLRRGALLERRHSAHEVVRGGLPVRLLAQVVVGRLVRKAAAAAGAVVREDEHDRREQGQCQQKGSRRVDAVLGPLVPDVHARPALERRQEVVEALRADAPRTTAATADHLAWLAHIRQVVGVGDFRIRSGAVLRDGAREHATQLRVRRHEWAVARAIPRQPVQGRAVRLQGLVASDVRLPLWQVHEAATSANDVERPMKQVTAATGFVQVLELEGLPVPLVRPPRLHPVALDLDVHPCVRPEIDHVAVLHCAAVLGPLDAQALPVPAVVPPSLNTGGVDVDVPPETASQEHYVARVDRTA